jgi:ABC-type multidrug transport system fused ATPase/permease subunit
MKRYQAISAVSLALIPVVCEFFAGCFLFVAPIHFLEHLLSCGDSTNSSSYIYKHHRWDGVYIHDVECPHYIVDVRMARLVGCVLLGQALSCFALMFPLLQDTCYPSEGAQNIAIIGDKFRSALASLSIMGLLLVVGGLVDDRSSTDDKNDCDTSAQSTVVIVTGAVTLICALTSMMICFWQPSDDHRTTQASHNEATVPLLAAENALNQISLDPDSADNADNTTENTSRNEEPTSRIQGTMRLLKLARPQVFYLYVGCAVLLVRLPFSLSIPHFVSTTLAAVSKADFAGARKEILLLFILGTIDAALDFWCVFLFGYANQRIVRGVRIDTFLSILRQEVAFFDETTSGELTSRLNSDCGEMAGDLTWFFRFSIESIVRITGIVSYMLLRCPILGVCALTIIPAVAAINKVYGSWLNKNARAVQDALAAANQVAQETFSCIRTVISFASEQQEYQKYKERIDHQYDLNVRQVREEGQRSFLRLSPFHNALSTLSSST